MMKKVMIVDDDELSREFLSEMLKRMGYSPSKATDGIEGLEKAKREKPDLILLDILMPRLHGFDLCKMIKSDEELKDTKVVMVSVKSFPADIKKAKDVGADDFISKPVEYERLKDVMDRLL
jgi:putative two-component system response regulator